MFAQNARGKSDLVWLRTQTLPQRPLERVIESQDIFSLNELPDGSSSRGKLRLTSMTRRPLLFVFLLGSLLIGLTVMCLGIMILVKFQRRRRLSSSLTSATSAGGSCHLTTNSGSSSDQLNHNEGDDDGEECFKKRSSSSGFLRRLTGATDCDDKCTLQEDFGDERRLTLSAARNESTSCSNGRKPYHPNDYGSSKGPPDIIPSFAQIHHQGHISFLAGCSSSSVASMNSSSVTSSPSGRRLSLVLPQPVLPSQSPCLPPPPPSEGDHNVDDDDDDEPKGVIEGEEDTAESSSGLNDKNFSAFGQSLVQCTSFSFSNFTLLFRCRQLFSSCLWSLSLPLSLSLFLSLLFLLLSLFPVSSSSFSLYSGLLPHSPLPDHFFAGLLSIFPSSFSCTFIFFLWYCNEVRMRRRRSSLVISSFRWEQFCRSFVSFFFPSVPFVASLFSLSCVFCLSCPCFVSLLFSISCRDHH